MLSLLLALALTVTPDQEFKTALADLAANVAPESRSTTRYASLRAIPKEQRKEFLAAFVFGLNSTSTSSQLVRPVVIGDLVRLDLTALGWDKDFRAEELKRLESEGVIFSFPNARVQARYTDIWEDFAAADPYYRSTYGQVRGWIDPAAYDAARILSESSKLLVRADWLLPRILLEAKDNGYYSQLLLLPIREGDLYKRFGENIKTVERFNQLRHGGATVGPSIVALHNRELQEIPSNYGYDFKYIWRTFDFATDADDPQKNVFRALAGSAVHDGREIIGTLPNGLHWYYLSDGKGVQVNVVPQAVALDQRNKRGISNPNVTNAIKCMDCHGPVSGIYPFKDNVRGAIISPEIALAVISKQKDVRTEFVPVVGPPPVRPHLQVRFENPIADDVKSAVRNRVKDLEEYYLSDLADHIGQQQDSYGRRVLACNGLPAAENTAGLMAVYNKYHEDLVDPEQAARELGLDFNIAIAYMRSSGNQDLMLLSTGVSIRRAVWERGFSDVSRVSIYPWEQRRQ